VTGPPPPTDDPSGISERTIQQITAVVDGVGEMLNVPGPARKGIIDRMRRELRLRAPPLPPGSP